jgi:hypothetical protein
MRLINQIDLVKTTHETLGSWRWSDHSEQYLKGGDAQEGVIRVRAMIEEKRADGKLSDDEFPFRVYAFDESEGGPLGVLLGVYHVHLMNGFVVVVE